MPELPEVETVRRGLAPVMEGALISQAQFYRAGLRFPFPPNMAAALKGRRIIAVRRRAKFLLIDLDNDQTLISHLGMSGSWKIEGERIEDGKLDASPPSLPQGNGRQKHDHVMLALARPGGQLCRVSYNDPRRFGFLLLAETGALPHHPLLMKLGVEPLGNEFSAAYIQEVFADKKSPLKTILLNQNIIAGLGNIYVCEALWLARLSPFRPAGDLAGGDEASAECAAELAASIRSVLEDALASGGSHLRNYVKADGSLGYFQHKFQVYGREGQACRRCGALIGRQMMAGRSTFYCGNCQK